MARSKSPGATLRRNTTLAETVKGTPGKLRAVHRTGGVSGPASPAASTPSRGRAKTAKSPRSEQSPAVGRRIGLALRTHWPDEGWFNGTVERYLPSQGKYEVAFEDGSLVLCRACARGCSYLHKLESGRRKRDGGARRGDDRPHRGVDSHGARPRALFSRHTRTHRC